MKGGSGAPPHGLSRGIPRRVKLLRKAALFWVLFLAGIVLGGLFYREILYQMDFVIDAAVSAGTALQNSPFVFTGIFLKNALVGALCVVLGRPSKGVFPAAVCLFNGMVVGSVVFSFDRLCGVAAWRTVLALAPHGVPEVSGLALACAAGTNPQGVTGRFGAARGAFTLFLVAAAVEAWVSPLVVEKIL